MRRVSAGSISRRAVIIYISVFIIIIVLTVGLSYWNATSRLEEELTYTNLALLNQIEQNVDMLLKEIDRDTMNFMQEPELSDFMDNNYGSDAQRHQNFYKLSNKMKYLKFSNDRIYSIYLYSYSSNIVLTDSTSAFINDFYDKQWINVFRGLAGYYTWLGTRPVIEPAATAPLNKNVITLLRPYPLAINPKYAKGAIVVNVDEDMLYNIIKSAKPQRLGYIFITDQKGHVLSNDDKGQLYKNMEQQPYMKAILDSKGQGRIDVEIDQRNSSVFYLTSGYTGWKYITVIPDMQFNQPLVAVRNVLLLIALSMAGIAILIVLLVSNWAYKPVDNFVHAVAAQFKAHNLASVEDDTLDNLETIFNRMIADNEKMHRQIQDSIPAIKWRLVMDILMGYRVDYNAIKPYLDLLNLSLYPNNFIIMTADLDKKTVPESGISTNNNMAVYVSALCDVAEQYMSGVGKGIAVEINERKVVMLMSFENDGSESNQMGALSVADLIREFMRQRFNVSVTMGIGRQYRDLCDVGKSYKESLEALKYKILMGNDAVISIEDVQLYDHREFYRFFDMIDDIVSLIKNADARALHRRLPVLFDQIKGKKLPPEMIKQLCMHLIMEVMKAADEMGLAMNEMPETEYDVYAALQGLETIEEIYRYIAQLFEDLMNRIMDRQSDNRGNELIDMVLSYINANYTRSDLSLNLIADTFNISVPYLSKLFKDSTGDNFMDYLIAIRMNRAKELLESSNKKINDISQAVGYANIHSFIRIFKKYTGITPGEYREQIVLKRSMEGIEHDLA